VRHFLPRSVTKVFATAKKKSVEFSSMDDNEFEFPEVWDEFQWERFLQEQDRNTEKYFRLMEQYMDHPDRDQLVAKEMGWEQVPCPVEEDSEDWEEYLAMEEMLAEEALEEEMEEEEDCESYLDHPVYVEMVRLHHWLEEWLENHPAHQENPHAVRLATQAAVCSAKLAAALSQEEDEDVELGMVIAYLKRALKAANECLDCAAQMRRGDILVETDHSEFLQLLFSVRNQIVDLMRESRSEWMRRYGHNSD
jgi:hypothetical protein